VQLIAWEDLSLKRPILCRVGRYTLLNLNLGFICVHQDSYLHKEVMKI